MTCFFTFSSCQYTSQLRLIPSTTHSSSLLLHILQLPIHLTAPPHPVNNTLFFATSSHSPAANTPHSSASSRQQHTLLRYFFTFSSCQYTSQLHLIPSTTHSSSLLLHILQLPIHLTARDGTWTTHNSSGYFATRLQVALIESHSI